MGFRDAERGQSIQIGAVLLFAMLILTFSIYQAAIVPSQNRGVEANHHESVQRDMIEVRNTLLDTYTGGDDGYASVALGMSYPPRLIALNPPSPSGELRTTEVRPIIIEEQGGPEITESVCPGTNIETRFLEYDPTYSLYKQAGTLRYEHSVLYNDFGDDSISLTSQTLVRGGRVQVIPITNRIGVGGSRTVAIEPKAGRLDTSVREDVTVTLPTRLSESRWEEILDGEVDPGNVSVTTGAAGRNLTLSLGGERRIECGPVGIGETPPSGPRGGGIDTINPAAPGDVRLTGETRSGSNMTLTFNNTAGTNNITEARINFYQAQGGGSPAETNILEVGQPVSGTLVIRGDYQTMDPKIRLDGEGTVTNVRLSFDQNVQQNDWFILSVVLESGETGLYFIPGG